MAKKRLKEVEECIPIQEQKQGQMALFEVTK